MPPTASLPVLVVDDSDDNREMYAAYLRFHGFRVGVAVNGMEAVTQVQEIRPVVVVMDLSMPEMDGWEATRRIRALSNGRIRVIAMTGHSDPELIREARAAGCDDVVIKPFSPADLLVKIRAQVVVDETGEPLES